MDIPTTLPTLFISHGAPSIALDPGTTGPAWGRLGKAIVDQFGKPSAILVLSSHWVTAEPAVMSWLSVPVIHDFYGFPEQLYQLDYPSPGSPDLARRIQSLLQAVGMPCQPDPRRGLDHGAWVPLRFLFPQADIPVLQVSMPYPQVPEYYFKLGGAMRSLAGEGVLMVGSGSLTHNLGEFQGQPSTTPAYPYVKDFTEWMTGKLIENDLSSLFNYRALAPSAVRAHPHDDHLMPLFFALGAGAVSGQVSTTRIHQATTHGFLSMDCFGFGAGSGFIAGN